MGSAEIIRRASLIPTCLGLIIMAEAAMSPNFERFAGDHDKDADAAVSQEEFSGAPDFFRFLDKDGDGRLTLHEFEAADRESRAARGKSCGRGREPRPPNPASRITADRTVHRDLEYARVEGRGLELDLYAPETPGGPLVAWTRGDEAHFDRRLVDAADTGAALPDAPAGNFTVSIPDGVPVDRTEEEPQRLAGFHWMVGPRAGLEGPAERFQKLLDHIDKNLSENTHVRGVYVITHWKLIEPREGVFEFGRLNRVIEHVRRSGRYVKLAVVPGIYTPAWVYEKGAEAFDTVGSNPARKKYYKKPVRLPVPWDRVYRDSYFRAIAEVAERFGDDPHLRAVTMSAASFMSPEWHLPPSREDRRKWRSMAGFPGALESAWKDGIDRFARLFPRQILVLEASSYPVEQKELGDAVVAHGAEILGRQFAVQINQLSGRFDQSNRPTYVKLLDYRRRYGRDIAIGLQNVKGWGFPKIRAEQGSKEMTAYNFLQANGEYWELWFHDGASLETCAELAALWAEGKAGGLAALKKRLVTEGKFRATTDIRRNFR